jgi:hypothetical protein
MEKTSVYLGERERRRLSQLAREEGTSQAEIIRRAIAAYEPKRPDREFRMFDSGRGPGGSVADIPKRELLKGFGESSLGER